MSTPAFRMDIVHQPAQLTSDFGRIGASGSALPIHRRDDPRVPEVHLGALELDLLDQHQLLVLLDQGRLGVDLLLGDGVLGG